MIITMMIFHKIYTIDTLIYFSTLKLFYHNDDNDVYIIIKID